MLQPGQLCVGQDLCPLPSGCQTVGDSGGHSAGQYCTQDCGQAPEACGDAAVCSQVGAAQLCLSRCPAEGSATHCASKSVCKMDSASGAPLCFPSCETDADCAVGTCDTFSGLCSNQPRGAGSIGSQCTSDSDCDGRCEMLAVGVMQCTKACKFGNYETCQSDICLPLGSGFELYSEGLCRRACVCDADCGSPALVCDPFTDLPIVKVMHPTAQGMCRPADAGATSTPCGD